LGTRDNLGLEEFALGFDQSSFAKRNVLREGVGLDLFEELGELAESVEHAGGRGGEGQGGLGLGLGEFLEDAERVAQERVAFGIRSQGTVGGEEGRGIGGGQSGLEDRLADLPLLLFEESAQRIGDREGQARLLHGFLERGCEVAHESITLAGPGTALAEELGGGGQGEAVVVEERLCDPRFVHGSEGPARGVGAQEQGFGRGSPGLFDDDGQFAKPRLPGRADSLKAVDDFEDARLLFGRNHPNGHGRHSVVRGGDLASQRSPGHLDLVHGNDLYRSIHGRRSPSSESFTGRKRSP